MTSDRLVLDTQITCPECGKTTSERMPVNACRFFWECPSCRAVIRPRVGDCCVYCSYGSVRCPPAQMLPPEGVKADNGCSRT